MKMCISLVVFVESLILLFQMVKWYLRKFQDLIWSSNKLIYTIILKADPNTFFV